MENEHKISARDLQLLLISHFRYSIGRKNVPAYEVESMLRRHSGAIEEWMAAQFVRDISVALGLGMIDEKQQVKDYESLSGWLSTQYLRIN